MLDIATEPWGIKVCFEFVFGESSFFGLFLWGKSRSVLNLCLDDKDRDKDGHKYEDKKNDTNTRIKKYLDGDRDKEKAEGASLSHLALGYQDLLCNITFKEDPVSFYKFRGNP